SKISLDPKELAKHRQILTSNPGFAENIRTLFENKPEFKKSKDPEAQLYDGFVPESDTLAIEKVRNSSSDQLADLHPEFTDERLPDLLLHYKARNFAKSLAEDEIKAWEEWRAKRITGSLPSFVDRLQQLS